MAGRRVTGSVPAIILSVSVFGGSSEVRASCSSLVSGNVTVDIKSCQQIVPEQAFNLSEDRYAFIADLDAANRSKFLNTYRGIAVESQIVNSQANRGAINGDRGALLGEKAKMFIRPGGASCQALQQKRVAGFLKEVCCDGGGALPCLLETGFILENPRVVGAAGAANAQLAKGQKAQSSAEYKEGEKLIKAKKFKEGIKAMESARSKKELDVRGLYMLAVVYRSSDRCKDGVHVMRELHEMTDNPDLFEEERKMVRKATFLYARCLARLNKGAESVLVLQGYLVEAGKFKEEIQASLKHPDFGFINVFKEYRDYRKAAMARLRALETGTEAAE